jgi:RNA polymerase sigma-70 factor (ECF subfamily)
MKTARQVKENRPIPVAPETEHINDTELVRRCMRDDGYAWEEILRRYKKRVFNISYQFVGRMDEAEDLTQEIFFKVFHSLDKFNQEANFQYWIIRVSKNYCIDYYRKKRKERESMVDNMEQVITVLRSMSTPQLVLEEKERQQAIRESISSLPPILRSCIVLRNLYGYSYQDIARILGIPEGTVKSRINRGRLELSRKLDIYFTSNGSHDEDE